MRPLAAALAAAGALALGGTLVTGCSTTPAPSSGASTLTTVSPGAPGATASPVFGSTTTTTLAPPAPLAWHACDQRFKCATLPVPIDYSDLADGTIGLAVAELPATGAHPLGDIVLNPGGPGASGVQYLEQSWNEFPASLRADFSLVGFDPRGIGGSDPVVCLPPSGIRALLSLPPDPTTAGEVGEVAKATRGFVKGCEQAVPRDVLANLGTATTARDLDRLRAALGQARLTYVGFSYGTYLGAVYAQLFPTHVRAMVLDGALDPSLSTVAIEEQQGAAFEVDLHDFLAWCGTSGQCGAISHSDDPGAAYEQFMAGFAAGKTLTAHLPSDYGGTQVVDQGTALYAVATGLYAPSSWPQLASALAAAEQGDGTDLALFADFYAGQQEDGSFSNIVSAEAAIDCLDRPSPSGLATYERLATRFAAKAPDFGGMEAWGSLACAYWPIRPTGRPFTVHAPGLPPVLVVGSTRDPATPYAWAKALAAQLPGAALLTRTGDGHTAYSYSSCVRSWVDRYLTTLALPPAGTVCASDGAGLP